VAVVAYKEQPEGGIVETADGGRELESGGPPAGDTIADPATAG
jgi:hypothetical protein